MRFSKAALVLAVALVGGCSGEEKKDSHADTVKDLAPFRPAGEGFSIDLPGEPTSETTAVTTSAGTVDLHQWRYSDEHDTAVVSWSQVPPRKKEDKLSPEAWAKDYLTRAETRAIDRLFAPSASSLLLAFGPPRVLESREDTVDGAPARDTWLVLPGTGGAADLIAVMRYRFVLRGDRLYQVMQTFAAHDLAGSFKLLEAK